MKGIVTQGRHVNPRTLCCIQRVTQYKVMWSKDGVNWNTMQDQQGKDLVSIMQLFKSWTKVVFLLSKIILGQNFEV